MQLVSIDATLAGVIDTIHRRTAGYDRVAAHDGPRSIPTALAVIVRGANIIASINRAMVNAERFVESDGQHTRKGEG